MNEPIENESSPDTGMTRRELLTIYAQISVVGTVAVSFAKTASATTARSLSPARLPSQPLLPTIAPLISLEEHLRVGMSQTSVNQVLQVRHVTIQSLRIMKVSGIRTAFDLKGCERISGISSAEWGAIRGWLDTVEARLVLEHRTGHDYPHSVFLGCNPKWNGDISVPDDSPKWYLCDDAEGRQKLSANNENNNLLSEEDFTRLGMSRKIINHSLADLHISIRALKLLKEAGIRNALELSQHTPLESIPPREWQVMVKWCEMLRSRYANQHRLGFINPTW